MLKRTSIKHINKLLEKNSSWNILDVGCGYRAHPKATIIADKQNFFDFYKGRKFIQIKDKVLPFKDKEFDFVIASHVIEHVEDFEFFIKELERISSKGYIELPSRLGDNLVFENKTDHIWWCFNTSQTISKRVSKPMNYIIFMSYSFNPFIDRSRCRV